MSDVQSPRPASAGIIHEVSELLQGPTGPSQESRILDFLRPLGPAELVEVLEGLDLERLLQALDFRVWGVDSRSEFLTILEGVAGGLSVPTKVVLCNLLADGPTAYREEKVLRALFLSERGASLTELKLGIDTSSDGHDLLYTLTDDIDSPELRFDILKHFREAAELPKDPKLRPLRVVSDIDDTLYSSLKDSRYPKGTIYKGVLELYAALSTHAPVFLTARPELVAALFERLTHRQLREYGLKTPTVLSGNLPGLMGHRRMAEQKARTLASYIELYPEFRFVFFGDSGQGDMALSEALLSLPESVIERAFIHKLSDLHAGSKTTNSRIHLYSDYAEAAEIVSGLGYLEGALRDAIVAGVRGSMSPS